MPRIANEMSVLLAELHARLARLVETAMHEGHDAAMAEIRSIVGGSSVSMDPLPVRRGPGRPFGSKNKPKSVATAAIKPKQKRKNSWAGLSPAERLARVNAIRKGKGLPPRSE